MYWNFVHYFSYFQRTTGANAPKDSLAEKISNGNVESVETKAPIKSQSSLVFGYLNLFSDGVVSRLNFYLLGWLLVCSNWYHIGIVFIHSSLLYNLFLDASDSHVFVYFDMRLYLAQHNFTDGMALGSAFLLYGSVGGWSRTLFLLAHELPQEVWCSVRCLLLPFFSQKNEKEKL